MMMRFWEESRPDLLESLSFASRLGLLAETVEVETGTKPLVVRTFVSVLLPLVVITVVVNCCVRLLTDFDLVCILAVDVSVDRKPGVELVVEPVPLTTELPIVEVSS